MNKLFVAMSISAAAVILHSAPARADGTIYADVYFFNNTPNPVTLQSSNASGVWNVSPPTTVAPGATVEWISASNGGLLPEGTGGNVSFALGGNETVNMSWSAPWAYFNGAPIQAGCSGSANIGYPSGGSVFVTDNFSAFGGAVSSNGSNTCLYEFELDETSTPAFEALEAGGCASSIGLGPQSVWVTGCTTESSGGDGIYYLSNTQWVQTAGQAKQIAVSPEGTPWLVNAQGAIYKQAGAGWTQLPGCATSIGVGPKGEAWITGCTPEGAAGNYGIYELQGSTWVAQPGQARHVAVSPEGTPWVVNAQGTIYEMKGGKWTALPGCATSIGVGPNEDAWVIGCSSAGAGGNGVYRWTGSSWSQIAGAAAVSVAVNATGQPMVVNAAGKAYYYSGANGGIPQPIQ